MDDSELTDFAFKTKLYLKYFSLINFKLDTVGNLTF